MAQALDTRPGADVIRCSRVYRDRHGIVAHSTSWIPACYGKLIPQLATGELAQSGAKIPVGAAVGGSPFRSFHQAKGEPGRTPPVIDLLIEHP
ncbi:hypothetical protein GCM10023235_35090 [Kitasatospora terrestris]|uniref:Uncharacterized protein n=1 Tax=Kitasatospora terrestris TaxID=258051 RepID=A0ABP9DQS9_9ACTN